MDTPRTGHGAQSPEPAEPTVATLATRVARVLRGRSSGRRSRPRSPDVGWERRLETLEARIAHLEAELEGFQDAVYRQSVREDENIDELRRRTAPEQIARDLSEDARRRGL
jgi:uncharacterized coiled-coil protein SlyX